MGDSSLPPPTPTPLPASTAAPAPTAWPAPHQELAPAPAEQRQHLWRRQRPAVKVLAVVVAGCGVALYATSSLLASQEIDLSGIEIAASQPGADDIPLRRPSDAAGRPRSAALPLPGAAPVDTTPRATAMPSFDAAIVDQLDDEIDLAAWSAGQAWAELSSDRQQVMCDGFMQLGRDGTYPLILEANHGDAAFASALLVVLEAGC